MIEKGFIRATTNTGKQFILELPEAIAIMAFKNIYDTAKGGLLPTNKYLPQSWQTEMFMEFTKPTGVIIMFEVCAKLYDEVMVLNSIWFETDAEGRRHLKSKHTVDLTYTFVDTIKQHEELHGITAGHFHQYEMSQDWHIGYYEQPTVPDEDIRTLIVRKDRERIPGDNSGVFQFAPVKISDLEKALDEGIAMTFEESQEMDAGDFFATHGEPPDDDSEMTIDVSPGGSSEIYVNHNHSDIYSAPAIEKTKYRLYINGHPTKDLVDDIGFIHATHDSVLNGRASINDIQGFMEMPQWIYDMLDRFLRLRDFKIGAHPVDEVLEDGNDAEYSLFWGLREEYTIYITPLTPERDRDEPVFRFDDIDF